MSMSPSERDPCPDCILDDAGFGFAVGAVGGSSWYFLKGLRHSPNGKRMTGGIESVRMNVPRVAGSFAVWGGLYSAMNCTTVFVRQKEDPWNSIIAGAATGGILSLRQGLRAAGRSALFTGAFFVAIESAGLMFNRGLTEQQNRRPLPADNPNLAATVAAEEGGLQGINGFPGLPHPSVPPTEVRSSSGWGSWLGAFFGKEEKPSVTGGKSEILESFETPSPPIPSFEYK